MRRYRHVISLGASCSTAAELAVYGYRDGSYPFDWVICDIEAVTTLIESDFAHYIDEQDLMRETDPSKFSSTRMGVRFIHDFSPAVPLAEQYAQVARKYERRVARFITATSEPTLFVRRITDDAEHSWLDSNLGRLLCALRKRNRKNSLVLVAHASLPNSCGGLRVHPIESFGQDGDWEFDRTSSELHHVLDSVPYSARRRQANHSWPVETDPAGIPAHRTRLAVRRTIVMLIGEDRFARIRARMKTEL